MTCGGQSRWVIAALCLSLFNCGSDSMSSGIDFPEKVIVYSDSDDFINTMNADGSNKRRFFGARGHQPVWSPQGKHVAAYWWDNAVREEWLVVLNVSDGGMQKLASVRGLNMSLVQTYSWSEDGQAIAFNRTKRESSGSDLCVVNIEDGMTRQLTNGEYSFNPVWSPDGARIAFDVSVSNFTFCHIMNSDGSDNKPAPYRGRGLVRNVVWSPDGTNVAFFGAPDSSLIGTNTMNVYVGDLEGKQIRQITDDGLSGAPSWSPDGESIAFVSWRDGGLNGFVMKKDGTRLVRLTSHGKVIGGPLLWSPDGTKLLYPYFGSAQSGTTIGVVNSNGSEDSNLGVTAAGGFSWKMK